MAARHDNEGELESLVSGKASVDRPVYYMPCYARRRCLAPSADHDTLTRIRMTSAWCTEDAMNYIPEANYFAGQVNKMRQAFASSVAANKIKLARGWGEPCCAYNLYIALDCRVKDELARVQEYIMEGERSLLQVPGYALHINVAWLLPVHESSAPSKSAVWEANKERWNFEVEHALAGTGRFVLTFRSVIATDSAVIAVAEPAAEVNRFREILAETLAVPWDICRGDLVHSTIFRYARPLEEPAELLSRLAGIRLSAEVSVEEIILVREKKFPSLEFDVLRNYPL